MKQNKVSSLLGLSMKAGKLMSGEFAVEQAVKANTAVLVILAEDASKNTRKKFENMCTFYKTEWITYLDKESLGRCIGKDYRAVLAVTDEGLAKGIKKQMDAL